MPVLVGLLARLIFVVKYSNAFILKYQFVLVTIGYCWVLRRCHW